MIRIDRHISVDCDCGACPSMYCQDLDDDATPDQIAGASFELVKAVREAGWEVTSPNCTICPACIATRERDITTDSVRHLAGTVLPPQGAGEVEYAIHDGGNELYRKTEAGYDCWQQDKRHWVAGCGFPTWQERIDNKHVTTVTTPQAREQFPQAFEVYCVSNGDLWRRNDDGTASSWADDSVWFVRSMMWTERIGVQGQGVKLLSEADARARFPAAFEGSVEYAYALDRAASMLFRVAASGYVESRSVRWAQGEWEEYDKTGGMACVIDRDTQPLTTPQAREQFPDAFEGESDAWTMFYGVTPTDGLYRCTVPGRPQLWKPKAGIWLDSNNYRTYSDFCSLSGDRITEPDARARFPAAFGGSKEGEYIIYKETLIYRRTEDKPELWTAHDPTWRISTDFMSWGDLIDEKRASAIAPTEARKIMEGGE